MHRIKGMVQVSGTTYRVERIVHGVYKVIRLSDEVVVGRFSCAAHLQIEEGALAAADVRAIAHAAVRAGKTSWVGPRPELGLGSPRLGSPRLSSPPLGSPPLVRMFGFDLLSFLRG